MKREGTSGSAFLEKNRGEAKWEEVGWGGPERTGNAAMRKDAAGSEGKEGGGGTGTYLRGPDKGKRRVERGDVCDSPQDQRLREGKWEKGRFSLGQEVQEQKG